MSKVRAMAAISAVAPQASASTSIRGTGQPVSDSRPEPGLWRASHFSSGVRPISSVSRKAASTDSTKGAALKMAGASGLPNTSSADSGKVARCTQPHRSRRP
jgi:hypothetical protein